jgi:hypothetical protein
VLHSCSCGCCPRRPLKPSSQHAYISKQFATRVYFPLRTSTPQASCNGCCFRTSKRLSSAMASLDRSCPNPALATARAVRLFFLPDNRWKLFLPVLQVCLEAWASNLDVSAPFRRRVGRCQHAGDGTVGKLGTAGNSTVSRTCSALTRYHGPPPQVYSRYYCGYRREAQATRLLLGATYEWE